ncbi:MAG: peptidyl-alpha-hydroxyglycine alpha-amidating lyase family protein [Rhodothermales bacterium]
MRIIPIILVSVALSCGVVSAQAPPVLPFAADSGFFKLPEGWNFGQTPGVAVNTQGHIYVFTRMPHALLEFDASGNYLREIAPGLFVTPHGLRVDADDNIWVTDLGLQQVLKLDPNGRILMVFGIKGAAGTMIDHDGLKAPVFDKPTDVAFDRYGNIYVSDGYGNSRVVKFDADGNFVKAWGEPGSGPGDFNLPHSILVDARDRVWVADRNNSRIELFDLEGNFLEQWTHVGWPWGFEQAADGNVWMADGTNNRIIKLSLDGEILATFGKPGKHQGQLGWVHYLTEAADGSILVGEIVNQRPQRFVTGQRSGSPPRVYRGVRNPDSHKQ